MCHCQERSGVMISFFRFYSFLLCLTSNLSCVINFSVGRWKILLLLGQRQRERRLEDCEGVKKNLSSLFRETFLSSRINQELSR